MGTGKTEISRMEEQSRQIIEFIKSQKLDENQTASYIYTFFAVVAISMIFECIVRSLREQEQEKKMSGEPTKECVKKLLITYLVHVVMIIVVWFICQNLLKFPPIFIWFLILITVCFVEIFPLYTRTRKNKNKKQK